MKIRLLISAAGVLLASSAFAQMATTGATGAMSANDFVQKVAVSDMFEIQSSQLALEKKADRDTKPFAQKMVKDHKKTTSELKALMKKANIQAELPTALDADHQGKLDQLKGLSGREFDVAYDKMQMEAHQQAVSLFEGYAQGGDNPQLKQWAAKTLPALKMHKSMADKLH